MAKKTTGAGAAAGIAAGLVAASTAAAAGYYFYADKNAKKNRKVAAKWANDLKKDAIREAKKLRVEGAKDFGKVVDQVSKTYREARAVKPEDVKRVAAELKANWDKVQREAKLAGAKATKTVKKEVKKAVKKAAKKAAKKH
ncbi:MAG: hypothetical protein WAN50_02090 [Minisyncoccia bacterium]